MVGPRVILIIAGFVAACGSSKGATKPEPLPENRAEEMPAQRPGNADVEAEAIGNAEDREVLAIALRVLDDLGAAAASAQGRCGVAAGLIGEIIRSNDALWLRLAEISREPDREELLSQSQDQIDERMQRFADALGPCAFDGRVRTSLEGMTFTN